jgi:hypothetical protein
LIQVQAECLEISEAHVVDCSLVAVTLGESFAQVQSQLARVGVHDAGVPRQIARVDVRPADKVVRHVGFDVPVELLEHAVRREIGRIQPSVDQP